MASPVHTYFYSMVEIGVVKFFVDNGIYRAIPHEENASVSYRELASKVGVQLNLLERFLNFLIAANALSAPTFGHVAHTASSRIFLREDASRFYQHVFDFFLVSAAHWPEYFNTHGPMEPKYAKRAPYGLAAGSPNKTLYEILDTMPQVCQLNDGEVCSVMLRINCRKQQRSTRLWPSPLRKCQPRAHMTLVGSRSTYTTPKIQLAVTTGWSWWMWEEAKAKSSRASSSRMLLSRPIVVCLKISPTRLSTRIQQVL